MSKWNESDQVMVADENNSWRHARAAVVVAVYEDSRYMDVVYVDAADAEVHQVMVDNVAEY